MDNKRLISVILVSFVLVMGWTYLSMWMKMKHPEWYPPETPGVPQTQNAATQPAAVTQAAAVTQPAGIVAAEGAAEAQGAKLGLFAYDPKQVGTYPIGVELGAQGAAVRMVSLNWYRQEVKSDTPYTFQRPYEVGPANRQASLATQGITVNGQWVDLYFKNWKLDSATEDSAVYSVRVSTPAGPIIVRKRFAIRPAKSDGMGYEVQITHEFVNEGNAAAQIQLWFNGPTAPHVENSRDIAEVVSGHLNKDKNIIVEHTVGTSFKPDNGAQPIATDTGPIQWTGIVSTYFDAIVRPVTGKDQEALKKVEVNPLQKYSDDGQVFLNLTLETSPLTVAAGGTGSLPVEVYFGPRHRDVLKTPYYEKVGYQKTLVLAGGFCGMCTFQWLVDALVILLKAFHVVLRDWGLAIIALVCVVRTLLHPITKKSQVMMARMGKMGPEMEKLKKKYGDDKEELQRQMVALYKEQGFTPILGCLPMFLQMPIWIALWSSLQSTFELRHAPFLWGWTWIHDLAQPDRLISFAPTHIFFFTLDAVNILPGLLALVFWIQYKVTPKPPVSDPQQAQQQKMMQWMTLLFPVMLYTGPSGLNLYILASTTIGIIESKVVRKHIAQQEAAAKEGKVIVDAKVTRATRKAGGPAKEEKKGGLAGWMEKLQKMAEDAQKNSEGRKKNK